MLISVVITLLCLVHVKQCLTGETTKERIKGIDTSSKCFYFTRKKQKFNLRYKLTEEQARKIEMGPNEVGLADVEISEIEQSISN